MKHDLIFRRENASISFNNNNQTRECRHKPVGKMIHCLIWQHMLEFLKTKGFKLYKDGKFKKQYPTLLNSHWWGSKNRLKFETDIYPAGFSIKFFQNMVCNNPHGGNYDFNKYRKMPKGIKISFNHISKTLIDELVTKFNLKFYDASVITFPPLTAEEKIIKIFRESSFTRNKIESLDQIESYMSEYDHRQNSNSGVGDILKCGEVRRFKRPDGKMRKGRIYHNINNMWWVITSKYKFTNIWCREIFEVVN